MSLSRWALACQALACLALDPQLGGILVRARVGPARTAWLDRLATHHTQPLQKLHTAMGPEALWGGLDLTATLAEGRPVHRAGLLEQDGTTFVLPMAERATPGFAGLVGRRLDQGHGALVALDEAAEGEDAPPLALTDRLGLHIDLDGVALSDISNLEGISAPADLDAARARLPHMTCPAEVDKALVTAALALGVPGLRGSLFARRCALACAALAGRDQVTGDDVELALTLCLLPRATQLPAPPEAPDQEDAPPPQAQSDDPAEADAESPTPTPFDLPAEMLVAAAQALLPADLLARLAAGKTRKTTARPSAGSGDARRSNRRGRPLPPRPGRLDGQSRLDLVATLRAAAPWQPMRRRLSPHRTGLLIQPDDIRLKRYEEKSDRLLIFSVDASGSAAMARLAEAKGAVELLLAEAYARRDTVALVAFRGGGADVLLPPTRSLVQTKRRLGALPGGGGTPLAAGLSAAQGLAEQARSRGMTPSIALLTDGRANIALDGSPDRKQAAEDATRMARGLAASGVPSLVIDTGARPTPQLRDLAGVLDAPYLPLPRADAQRLSGAVTAALDL